MVWRTLKSLLGALCLVGLGLGALVGQKVVAERGAEVVTEPVFAALQRLKPVGDAIEIRFARLRDRISPPDVERIVAPADTSAPVAAGPGETTERIETAAVAAPTIAAPAPRLIGDCGPVAQDADVAVLGDRLSLRFFEESGLPAGPNGGAGPAAETIIFERLDLSGSYEIGVTGTVSLPAIGHVDVIGRELPCVETLVARAASERLRVNASISAAFAARPPILVRGTVRAPGAHAYSPGLTVERVLAQAGVVEEIGPLSALQLASLQAREDELSVLAASLFVERARIEAALDGNAEFAADAAIWAPVADVLGADRIESERAVLVSQLAEEAAERERLSDRIDDLVLRIASAQQSLTAAQEQLAYLTTRDERLRDILAQGMTQETKVEEATVRRMEVSRIVLDKRETLTELEGALRMARHELEVREAGRYRELAEAMRDTTKEGSSVREQIRTVRAQISVQDGTPDNAFLVTIERPEPHGTTRFTADPATIVRPGDLVTVDLPQSRDELSEIPISGFGFEPIDELTPVNWR